MHTHTHMDTHAHMDTHTHTHTWTQAHKHAHTRSHTQYSCYSPGEILFCDSVSISLMASAQHCWKSQFSCHPFFNAFKTSMMLHLCWPLYIPRFPPNFLNQKLLSDGLDTEIWSTALTCELSYTHPTQLAAATFLKHKNHLILAKLMALFRPHWSI